MIAWLKNYPITCILVASNVVLFAAMVAGSGAISLFNPSEQTLIAWGADYGPLALTSEPWRVVTNAFVHCHLLHLVVNMYALFIVGPDLEQRFGKFQYLLVYFLSAVGGSVLSLEFNPREISAGASGAICGMVGAYLSFVPPELAAQAKRTFKRRLIILCVFVAINFIFAEIVGNVDNAAHTGGLITGLLFGYVVSKTMSKNRPLLVYAGAASILLFCLASYLFVSAQYDKDPRLTAYKQLTEGKALLQNKRYEEALSHFNKSLAIMDEAETEKSEQVSIRLNRSDALINLNRYEEALADANKASELMPDSSDVLITKALCLHKVGRYAEAVRLWKHVVEKFPGESMPYNNLAWSQLATGDLQEALRNVNVSLSKSAKNYAALDTRGVAYLMLNKPEKARIDLENAIEKDPESAGAYFHLAVLFHRLHREELCGRNLMLAEKLKFIPEQWETISFKDVLARYESKVSP